MLLDITAQLKHIMKAIEAIPLHLTLDIVRLDDAHGESWALPLQACKTWQVSRGCIHGNKRVQKTHVDSPFAICSCVWYMETRGLEQTISCRTYSLSLMQKLVDKSA